MQTRSRRGALAFLAAAALTVSSIALAAPSQATDQTTLTFDSANGYVKYGSLWNFGGIIGGEITAGPTGADSPSSSLATMRQHVGLVLRST